MNLRARLATQSPALLHRLPKPVPPTAGQAQLSENERLLSEAERIKAAVAKMDLPEYRGLACWLCDGHVQPCARVDCPKAWRLRDAPKMAVEGKAGGWAAQ
jgi:hypothetical protein